MKRLLVILFAMCCAMTVIAQQPTIERSQLPEGCRQAVVVSRSCEQDSATKGYVVSLIEYCDESEGGECGVVCKNFVATVGYRGLAPIGTKREGDGRTPVGIYPLRRGLCYERDFVSAFPMEQYDENDMWCEDTDSDDYNTFVSNPAPGVKGDRLWQLRNTQYRYIVVVEYNTDPIVKGAGSAIFIHAWRAEGKSTAGCIGMAEASVKQLVEWLDPALNPHIVILQN